MIELTNITKRFGKHTALDDLTLHIGEGEVYGFIGPNGAGKSTSMKILSGLLTPDSGAASVCGVNCIKHPEQIKMLIGYMPDFLGVYDDLTVDEYLQFFAAAFGIERRRRRAVVAGVIELVDLGAKRDAMVDALSRGMQQRLGVARVLLHEPKVLLLDEPASGLDPRARIELRELIGELRAMGKTIMVSSHILSELGEMSTSIGIIERGKLLFSGSIASAIAKAGVGEQVAVKLEIAPARLAVSDKATELLRVSDGLINDPRVLRSRVEGEVLMVDLKPTEQGGSPGHHFLIEQIMASGHHIASFSPHQVRLEDVFLRLTKGVLN